MCAKDCSVSWPVAVTGLSLIQGMIVKYVPTMYNIDINI